MRSPPKSLANEWKAKLLASGFVDIEDSKGRLKQPNTRTQAWETRDITAEFFQLLDHYLHTTELNRLERKILEMHAQGERLEAIYLTVYRSEAYVKNVIYKHRKIILHKI